MREFKGGDGKTPAREFLSSIEIRRLGADVGKLVYPMDVADFLKALPVNFTARNLGSNGSTGSENVWWREWPLTSRADPRGYFALVGILGKMSMTDHEGERIIRHAEVVFHDRALEQTLILQPDPYPVQRAPEPQKK